MKTRHKILIIIGLIILGVALVRYKNYQDYMNKQKERIELFFTYNYNNIESITFTETKKTPMGALSFYGYFNDNKKNRFIGKVMPDEKEFEGHIAIQGDFENKNFKFKDENALSVSEILKKKEETNDNTQESAKWFTTDSN